MHFLETFFNGVDDASSFMVLTHLFSISPYIQQYCYLVLNIQSTKLHMSARHKESKHMLTVDSSRRTRGVGRNEVE